MLITVGINAVFELTAGKKYWHMAAKNTKPKRKFRQAAKDFLMRAFARDKTKGFVWAGTVILIISFAVKLNAYYVISACVVFVMAALTRFAPYGKCATMQGGQKGGEEPATKDGGEEPAADAGTGEGVCGGAVVP